MPNESKTSIWLPFVSAVLGIFLGGAIQFYTSSWLETEKQLLQIRLDAYSDFLKGQAAWMKTHDEDARSKIRDAAFRIVVFSPAEVVQALTTFLKSTAPSPCHSTKAEIELYQGIRRQALGGDAGIISDGDMAMALFGCQLD